MIEWGHLGPKEGDNTATDIAEDMATDSSFNFVADGNSGDFTKALDMDARNFNWR